MRKEARRLKPRQKPRNLSARALRERERTLKAFEMFAEADEGLRTLHRVPHRVERADRWN